MNVCDPRCFGIRKAHAHRTAQMSSNCADQELTPGNFGDLSDLDRLRAASCRTRPLALFWQQLDRSCLDRLRAASCRTRPLALFWQQLDRSCSRLTFSNQPYRGFVS